MIRLLVILKHGIELKKILMRLPQVSDHLVKPFIFLCLKRKIYKQYNILIFIMNNLTTYFPNLITGASFGFSIGACFLVYKFYEDYKRQLVYKKIQEKFVEIGKAIGLSYALFLMIKKKLPKEVVKTIITQYYKNHPHQNEILILIDTINDNNLFSPPPLFAHELQSPIIPGPGSPFYNPKLHDPELELYHNHIKPVQVKATGLNFTSKKNKHEKVSKKVKKNTNSKHVTDDVDSYSMTDSDTDTFPGEACNCIDSSDEELYCPKQVSSKSHIKVDI